MADQAPGTTSYYVSRMRVRRELIPVYENDAITAYRCVTYAANGPQDGDKVLADQVEFEDVLIDMRLMPARDLARTLLAKGWRALDLDKLVLHRPTDSEPLETLLRIVQ